MNGRRLLGGLISASLLLFWLQALRAAFSSLFGIIYDQIFLGPTTAWLGISNLLLFLALLAPLALGGRGSARLSWLPAVGAAGGRACLSLPDPAVHYWASLAVLAAGSYHLADRLRREGVAAVQGLGVALCLDQLLRALGHTYDLSFQPGWLPLPLGWSGLLLIAALWEGATSRVAMRQAQVPEPGARWEAASGSEARHASGLEGEPREASHASRTPIRPASGWLAGLALGGWLFVQTSLLSVPNAAAGWSGGHYAALTPGLLIATCLPLGWAAGQDPSRIERISRWCARYLPAGLLFGYLASGPWAAAALLLTQAAAMLTLVGLVGAFQQAKAKWLAVGGLWMLLANYLNAFTFTYPYTLPPMRGLGWAVYLLAAAPITMCCLTSAAVPAEPAVQARPKTPAWAAAGIAVLLAAWSARPIGADSLPEGNLTLASYNIHYGYDSRWQFTLEEQAKTLESQGVEVVALQEVDAGRMTSYMVDDARYLARRLRMNAAYLPTVEHLTGIALLYRGEIGVVREQLLTSLQEQTGIVGVELPGSLTAFGVWLGLEQEDTLTQIQEALAFIGPASPAAFAGDFNALDDSAVAEAVRNAGFVDPFALLGLLPAPTDPAEHPTDRIDYVWLRGLTPVRAWVADSLASDHRMVVVEAEALP